MPSASAGGKGADVGAFELGRALDASDALLVAGRLQGLAFVQRVADVAAAQMFVQLKNTRKFIGLPYRDASGAVQHVGSLEEFCKHYLGKGSSRMYQLAENLQTLGPALYEQAELIGFRARDYQALNALSDADQTVVKTAIESGSRDEALNALTLLAARNEALRQQLKDDGDAKDRMIAKQKQKLDAIAEADEQRENNPTSAQLEDMRDATLAAEQGLNRLVKAIDRVLQNPASQAIETAARHTLDYIGQQLLSVAHAHDLTVNFDGLDGPPIQLADVHNKAQSRMADKGQG